MKCNFCKKVLEPHALFCAYCGRIVTKVFLNDTAQKPPVEPQVLSQTSRPNDNLTFRIVNYGTRRSYPRAEQCDGAERHIRERR